MGGRNVERNDINEGAIIMAVGITLRFDYPWNSTDTDENEIVDCLSELSPEELLLAANNAGEPINVDIEVY